MNIKPALMLVRVIFVLISGAGLWAVFLASHQIPQENTLLRLGMLGSMLALFMISVGAIYSIVQELKEPPPDPTKMLVEILREIRSTLRERGQVSDQLEAALRRELKWDDSSEYNLLQQQRMALILRELLATMRPQVQHILEMLMNGEIQLDLDDDPPRREKL